MSMGDEHPNERARAKRPDNRRDMTSRTDARIDQGGFSAVDEPGVVAGAGQRAGIVCVDENGSVVSGHENRRGRRNDRS